MATSGSEKDKKPKKLFVDLYTQWCGYCKKMDRQTFSDPLVAKYLNEHFYPVKFDAEQREALRYADHTFKYDPKRGRNGTHALAFALLDGNLQYPSLVYLDEKQKRIAISPGFKPADSFLRELRFFGDNHYKVMDYETYKRKEN
ncbi:MAG: thioredoxin family protein [Bacteroidota bacterium]